MRRVDESEVARRMGLDEAALWETKRRLVQDDDLRPEPVSIFSKERYDHLSFDDRCLVDPEAEHPDSYRDPAERLCMRAYD